MDMQLDEVREKTTRKMRTCLSVACLLLVILAVVITHVRACLEGGQECMRDEECCTQVCVQGSEVGLCRYRLQKKHVHNPWGNLRHAVKFTE